MRIGERSTRVRCSLALVLALAAGSAAAQSYPTKPILVITPLSGGGPYTIVMRGLGDALGSVLGRPVVLDSRLGGNGFIGMDACAKAPRDGYTLCFTNSTIYAVNPFLFAKIPYDNARDFDPLVQVGFVNSVIFAHPSVPVKDFRDLLNLARDKPDSLAYGTFAFGNLLVAWLKHTSGASFLSVPYNGAPAATTAVLGNQVQVSSNSLGVMQPLIKAGKVHALVVTGNARSSLMPALPSFRDFGMEMDFRSWAGMFAPSGTPADVVRRVNAEMNKLIADPRLRVSLFDPAGVEPAGGTPEEFAAYLNADRETAAQLVKIANIKPE